MSNPFGGGGGSSSSMMLPLMMMAMQPAQQPMAAPAQSPTGTPSTFKPQLSSPSLAGGAGAPPPQQTGAKTLLGQ